MTNKKDSNPSKKRDLYRIRNWKQYNTSLKNRGSITFWFSPEVIEKWYSNENLGSRGRPKFYSDDAILCALMIRAVFHCKLRQLQGFIESLIAILGLNLNCPHYSVFSRRARHLKIPLKRPLKPGESLNVIFDSTGLKVFGEGEWKTRKHGYSKRRTWRKLHVGMCVDSNEIVIGALSSNNVTDDAAMVEMMDCLDDFSLGDVYGDGAYDTIDCRMAVDDRGGRPVIPPPNNARLHKKDPAPCLAQRNTAIEEIRRGGEDGRKLWKEKVGYHKRSLVETFMFRFKTIVGDKLRSRTWANQFTESMIKLQALNCMTELGMPDSYKVIN
ncbi:IS5 family transposase [Candidatus Neptunichlamydia sp. REUL1]|uniref:IS5 family transposase n=1 Tax=Candidatus Neptunichlamydia sp. REUL1 TaxID=3064277 RepID=UPI00292FCD87|nr:IS5 family transposase [Candidatus Neptunochlamydia sp. REUL1]